MTDTKKLADMLRQAQEHDYNQAHITFSRVFVAELELALRRCTEADDQWNAALEAAALVCDSVSDEYGGVRIAADKIRALKRYDAPDQQPSSDTRSSEDG